jgi:hypothetical protein
MEPFHPQENTTTHERFPARALALCAEENARLVTDNISCLRLGFQDGAQDFHA